MPRASSRRRRPRRWPQFVAAYAGQIGKGPVVDTDEAPLPEPQDCPAG